MNKETDKLMRKEILILIGGLLYNCLLTLCIIILINKGYTWTAIALTIWQSARLGYRYGRVDAIIDMTKLQIISLEEDKKTLEKMAESIDKLKEENKKFDERV